jgi:CubicO group peptidase (beta-lactamase class C family)
MSSGERADAIYRIASMTKPIIAVAMLLLYEEGKWELDDPVTKFIPEFADLQVLQDGKFVPLDRPMTLRHLMASSAGFAFGPAFGSTRWRRSWRRRRHVWPRTRTLCCRERKDISLVWKGSL